ncbi:MAG: metallophosphoesterase [Bacteroides sp.]|nr:metallophosphoesterase [Eubacterium sp.]MCM1417749.1 metallophosphoesterase [Roseburia sp.]MCM1461360.1 metallophosphoesterase [Bacteroides sp.]
MTKRKKRGVAAVLAAVFAGAIAAGHTLSRVSYTVETGEAGEPIKLAFLSDVHNSLYGGGQSELIGAIDDFGADLVLFGGDLFDEHNGEENSWALVDALAERYPCYYAVGNHEIRTGKVEAYKSEMARRGVTVLSGTSAVVSVGGRELRLLGADGRYDGSLEKAAKALDERYSILLYHYPADFADVSEMGFDLVLAGHEHGGQWRIPGLLNGLYAPDEGFLPKYAGGRYERNGSTMLVSCGLYRNLSCILIPRIFNRPELLLVTLT